MRGGAPAVTPAQQRPAERREHKRLTRRSSTSRNPAAESPVSTKWGEVKRKTRWCIEPRPQLKASLGNREGRVWKHSPKHSLMRPGDWKTREKRGHGEEAGPSASSGEKEGTREHDKTLRTFAQNVSEWLKRQPLGPGSPGSSHPKEINPLKIKGFCSIPSQDRQKRLQWIIDLNTNPKR